MNSNIIIFYIRSRILCRWKFLYDFYVAFPSIKEDLEGGIKRHAEKNQGTFYRGWNENIRGNYYITVNRPQKNFAVNTLRKRVKIKRYLFVYKQANYLAWSLPSKHFVNERECISSEIQYLHLLTKYPK